LAGAALLLLALVLAGTGCAGDPAAGSSRAFLQTTAPEESAAVAAVREEMGLVDDEALGAYVESVGRRAAEGSSGGTPSFHLVDQDEPNVFADPEGQVFVSRGLLVGVHSESELAHLLAHQLAHTEAGDLTRRAYGVDALSFGAVVMRASLFAHEGREGGFPGYAMGDARIGRYPFESEAAADARARESAAATGFDPRGLARALRGLRAVVKAAEDVPLIPGFFVTHPSAPDRLALAQAGTPTGALVGAARERHLRRLDGMLVGPNPAAGIFVGDRFLHRDLGYSLRLPKGWKRLHSRNAVGAVSPGGEVQIVLERQGEGSDPAAAAQQFLDGLSERLRLRVERSEDLLGGPLPAHRMTAVGDTPGGPVQVDLTWYSFAGVVYRLASAARPEQVAKFQALVRGVARSFRPLSDRERSEIFEERLRVVAAGGGETLAEISARTGNVWSPAKTAAVNRVRTTEPLAAGRSVALAVRRPYAGRNLGAKPLAN
jgi:predicted Zn-dependent protease